MVDQGKDMADWIDSCILADIYKAAEFFDNQPVPMIGRYFWNPETNEVKAIDNT